MPLVGRVADQLLEPMRELLGDARDVLCHRTVTRARRGARRPCRGGRRRVGSTPRSAAPAHQCATRASPGRRAASCAHRRTRPRCLLLRCRDRTRRHSTPFDFSALIAAEAAPGPSGTTFIPRERRYSANHSNSSGGSSGSTITVIGKPQSAIQRPAHSQPPRCGRARMTPVPSAMPFRRFPSPSWVKCAAISTFDSAGMRNDSTQ